MARKRHTTCKVLFEDYSGDLHRVTVRIPAKVRLTSATVNRLASKKAGYKSALLLQMECSEVALPHRRRR